MPAILPSSQYVYVGRKPDTHWVSTSSRYVSRELAGTVTCSRPRQCQQPLWPVCPPRSSDHCGGPLGVGLPHGRHRSFRHNPEVGTFALRLRTNSCCLLCISQTRYLYFPGTQGLRCSEITYFRCSIKVILKRNGLFCLCLQATRTRRGRVL